MIEYGEPVRIKKGFYKGCEGVVVDYNEEYHIYDVEIDKMIKLRYRTKIIEACETSLEVIK